MKLELKHIVGYLPYGLKVIHTDFEPEGSFTQEAEIETISTECICFKSKWSASDYYFDDPDSEIKPILRPLSNLTKEIEVNGEKFVPIVELAKLTHIKEKHIFEISQSVKGECDGVKYSFGFYNGSFWMRRLRGKKWVDNAVFSQDELFEKLDEWHFDWKYNLIKNGLAIDINTLES